MSDTPGVPTNAVGASQERLETTPDGALAGGFKEQVDPDMGEYQGRAVVGFEGATAEPEPTLSAPEPTYDMEPWDMLPERHTGLSGASPEPIPVDLDLETHLLENENPGLSQMYEDFVVANDLPLDMVEWEVSQHADQIAELERYQTHTERLEEIQDISRGGLDADTELQAYQDFDQAASIPTPEITPSRGIEL